MIFHVKRNPITPNSRYEYVEVLLQKRNGDYLCRTNHGYVVLQAETFEQELEAMTYVGIDQGTEEVRAELQRRAVVAAEEKAEKVGQEWLKDIEEQVIKKRGPGRPKKEKAG
jgi:hypothetical protein